MKLLPVLALAAFTAVTIAAMWLMAHGSPATGALR